MKKRKNNYGSIRRIFKAAVPSELNSSEILWQWFSLPLLKMTHKYCGRDSGSGDCQLMKLEKSQRIDTTKFYRGHEKMYSFSLHSYKIWRLWLFLNDPRMPKLLAHWMDHYAHIQRGRNPIVEFIPDLRITNALTPVENLPGSCDPGSAKDRNWTAREKFAKIS